MRQEPLNAAVTDFVTDFPDRLEIAARRAGWAHRTKGAE